MTTADDLFNFIGVAFSSGLFANGSLPMLLCAAAAVFWFSMRVAPPAAAETRAALRRTLRMLDQLQVDASR